MPSLTYYRIFAYIHRSSVITYCTVHTSTYSTYIYTVYTRKSPSSSIQSNRVVLSQSALQTSAPYSFLFSSPPLLSNVRFRAFAHSNDFALVARRGVSNLFSHSHSSATALTLTLLLPHAHIHRSRASRCGSREESCESAPKSFSPPVLISFALQHSIRAAFDRS